MLIAPTEPPFLRSLGKTSSLPEKHGVDFLFPAKHLGVQRKTISDLLASLTDGRLSREVAQTQSSRLLDCAILLIEGTPEWTNEDQLIQPHTSFTRTAWYALLLSIQSSGLDLLTTSSITETSVLLNYLPKYMSRQHRSLLTRPKPKSSWGKGTNHQYASHLLQSFQGIGPATADAILTHYGKVPLSWTVTAEELATIPGIGKLTAERLINALT